MKKMIKHMLFPLLGAGYAALAVGLSRLLIRQLAPIFQWIGSLAGLDEGVLSYGAQILGQLKEAAILSPWLPALLIGLVVGALLSWMFRRVRVWKVIVNLLVWLILLLPLVLAAVWFTTVNAINVGALIQALLPMLSHLL